jgi:hypothetical protein
MCGIMLAPSEQEFYQVPSLRAPWRRIQNPDARNLTWIAATPSGGSQ